MTRRAPRRRWSRSGALPSGTARVATSLPEADAVLGFDDYPDIADRLRSILAGEAQHPHTPQDRRSRSGRAGHPGRARSTQPGHADRRRLDAGPMAPLKLASGCDQALHLLRHPDLRGSFVSRRPSDVLAEARWLARQARELFLVSENSTSYGKDLGDLRLLKTMADSQRSTGSIRVPESYLQPAETSAGLVTAIAATAGVAAYFDLSFQHASNRVLRRMRRFGDSESFLGLLGRTDRLPRPERAPTSSSNSTRQSSSRPGVPVRRSPAPDWTRSASSGTRRGRHRGRGLRGQ